MFDIRREDLWETKDKEEDGEFRSVVAKAVFGDCILCSDDYRDIPQENMERIHKDLFRGFKLLKRSLGQQLLCADYYFPEPSVLNLKLTDQSISLLKGFLPGYEIRLEKNTGRDNK